jgi:hypothetical protein
MVMPYHIHSVSKKAALNFMAVNNPPCALSKL